MATPTPAQLDALAATVQALLDANGIDIQSITELVANRSAGVPAARGTLVSEAVELMRRTAKPGAVKTYATYWRVLSDGLLLPASWSEDRLQRYGADLAKVVRELKYNLELPTDIAACPRLESGEVVVRRGFGDRRLDEVLPADVQVMARWVRANARAKAVETDRDRTAAGRALTRVTGVGAEANFVAATRCLYTAAQLNGLVSEGCSPAAKVVKPPRQGNRTRRPLTDRELGEVWTTCTMTGNDPRLDGLVLRLQLETASRQEGCINLKLRDLDENRQAVWLDQKNDKLQVFPVTRGLLDDLRALAHERGATEPEDYVLRQKRRNKVNGDPYPPLTSRRFDNIHGRLRDQHAWARSAEFSSHWLRHHVAARIEAIGGRPCKMRLLDHEPNGQTDGYGKASFEHLAWAHSQMTGELHPHAQRPPWVTG